VEHPKRIEFDHLFWVRFISVGAKLKMAFLTLKMASNLSFSTDLKIDRIFIL
jgi:hypothetical protein